MEIGPVQMLAFGFDHPKFEGAILGELKKLADADIIRVVDSVVVHKDANGEVETRQFTGLTPEEAEEFGAKVGALVGLGADGDEGIAQGAAFGAKEMDRRGSHALGEPGDWDVLGGIPNDTGRCRPSSGAPSARPGAASRRSRSLCLGSASPVRRRPPG
jgi:hypothetical protein